MGKWKAGEDQIVKVLEYAKKIFYAKEKDFMSFSMASSVFNRQALHLYNTDRKAYVKKVDECVQASLERRFVNEKNSTIRFTEPKSAHEKIRRSILGRSESNPNPNPDKKLNIDG